VYKRADKVVKDYAEQEIGTDNCADGELPGVLETISELHRDGALKEFHTGR
jgi:hypothetical protein